MEQEQKTTHTDQPTTHPSPWDRDQQHAGAPEAHPDFGHPGDLD